MVQVWRMRMRWDNRRSPLSFPQRTLIAVVSCCTTILGLAACGPSQAGPNHVLRPSFSIPLKTFKLTLLVRPSVESRISRAQAIAIALKQTPVTTMQGRLSPGIRVQAKFGLFTDDIYCHRNAHGKCRLFYERRPAWIVSFWGPGVRIRPVGGRLGTGAGAHPEPTARPLKHEISSVIDATTGSWLEGFS